MHPKYVNQKRFSNQNYGQNHAIDSKFQELAKFFVIHYFKTCY